jgi:hypothetical protein
MAFICRYLRQLGTEQPLDVFPPTNLLEARHARRTYHTNIREIVDDVGNDLDKTRAYGTELQLRDRLLGEGTLSIEIDRHGDLPLRLTKLVPPSRLQIPVASGTPYDHAKGRNSITGHLVKQYCSVINSQPNTAFNVSVSVRINRYRAGELSESDSTTRHSNKLRESLQ